MTERQLHKAIEEQIQETFTSQNTRELFPELELPIKIGDTPIQRTEIVVDIVLHSGTPLKGIKPQRQYNPDDEFSSDRVLISKRRKDGGTIGLALVYQKFDMIDYSDEYYLYERQQYSKPWIDGIPIWESQSSFETEN